MARTKSEFILCMLHVFEERDGVAPPSPTKCPPDTKCSVCYKIKIPEAPKRASGPAEEPKGPKKKAKKAD